MAPKFSFSGFGSSNSSTNASPEAKHTIIITDTLVSTKSQKANRRLSFRKPKNDSFQIRFSEQPTLDLPNFMPLSEMLDFNPKVEYTPPVINREPLQYKYTRAQRCLSMGDETLQFYGDMINAEPSSSSKTDSPDDLFLACTDSSATLTLRRFSESESRSALPSIVNEPKGWSKLTSWFTRSVNTVKPQTSHTIPSLLIQSKSIKKDYSKEQTRLSMSSRTSQKPPTIVTSSPQITKNHKPIPLPVSPITCHLCTSTALSSYNP